jgi:hypothetical protein
MRYFCPNSLKRKTIVTVKAREGLQLAPEASYIAQRITVTIKLGRSPVPVKL